MASKTGIAAVLAGLLVMAGVYWVSFLGSGLFVYVLTAITGGFILLGAFLVFLGLLMLLL